MLKTPVMISSEGKETKNSRRFWNSSKKVEILEDGGRYIDIEKDSFFVTRSEFRCHEFKRYRRRKILNTE